MEYTLSYQDLKENMAFAVGKNLGVSTKQSVEICSYVRGKTVTKAKKMLEQVMNLEKAVPMKRYHRDTNHKKEVGPGKYPIKTAGVILSIIKSAESNAQNKGLGTNLIIEHICAHKAGASWHYGRKRRRKMKRTHIEVVLVEEKKDVKND